MRNQISTGEMQRQKDVTPNSSRDDTRVKSRKPQSRLALAGSFLHWVGVAAAILFGYGEAGAQVISRVSAPGKFNVDDKESLGIVYNYAEYVISNKDRKSVV